MPSPDGSDERVVQEYLAALETGRVLDALSAFSMDASFRDESGAERHGIREIAALFARRGRPAHLELEDVSREGAVLVARVRMRPGAGRRPKVYRGVLRVYGQRIRSVEIEARPSR